MKRAKKKKDVRTKVMMSPKQLEKEKREAVEEAVHMSGMLYLAVLAEKGWSEDDIVDLFENVSRYVRYIDDHVIKLNEVQDIIEKHTGMKFKRW